jgi:hypothetical protein
VILPDGVEGLVIDARDLHVGLRAALRARCRAANVLAGTPR